MNIVKQSLLLMLLSSSSFICSAATPDNYVAVAASIGGRLGGNLEDATPEQTTSISDDFAQSLAIYWYHSPQKETELLFSNSKQHLKTSGTTNIATDIYIDYLHFGGRVLFVNDTPFSGSIGLGIGATFLMPEKSSYDNELAFSGNISGGIRYELTKQWALRSDLRFYGTVLNSKNSLLCNSGQCLVKFSGEFYLQTEITTGLEYKF